MPPFAQDGESATLDGAPDWQTMMANTVFNKSQMDPDWLIQRQPGMSCQSHTDILKSFATYNLVSVTVSVILATPFFYERLGSAKTYVTKSFKRLWRTVRRRKGGDSSQGIPYQNDINTDISIASFLSSTIGSIVISLAAPCLTGISLWATHRGNVNLWVIIQQWATRPRAACFVFAINTLIGWMKDFKGRPQGFVISALSTMIAEIPLSTLCLRFLSSQLRQYPQDSPSLDYSSVPPKMLFPINLVAEMQGYALSLKYLIYIQIGITGFIVFIVFIVIFAGVDALLYVLIYYTDPRIAKDFWKAKDSRKAKQDHKENNSKSWLLFLIPSWLISIFIYAFSYLLWHDFLIVTPDGYYCVEVSVYIDVIYYLLPVFLGLWRAIPVISSKSWPKQKPAVSIGISEGANSQDPKQINQAQRSPERQSLTEIRCLETQDKLLCRKRSTTI